MWNYSKKVQDYFVHPHNAGPLADANAIGEVGSIACGDALKLYLKINDQGVIEKASFETFGCASAIASSSVLTDMVIGMKVDDALKITNADIAKALDGLPREKMHCSVMGQEALEAAIRQWKGEPAMPRTQEEGKLVCKCFNVTDQTIIRAIRENHLKTVDDVTAFTKAGGGCGECRDEIAEILEAELKREGETIETLDGNARKLTPNMLCICDEQKPVAVAGVMGGANSEIVGDTAMVVFEGANFNGTSIRRTAAALGMRTEASGRFEKGLDPMNTVAAVDRACELVELLGCGEVMRGTIDVLPEPIVPKTVKLEPDKVNGLLGTDVSEAEMRRILLALGFALDGDTIIVPSWRGDVEHYSDIAEEIARFYGYNNIPCTLMRGQTTSGGYTDAQKAERSIGVMARALGYSEIITYSFISPSYYDKIRLPADSPLRNSMKILNPLGEDTSIMRTTILPSMLEILTRNYNYRNKAVRLYEIGKVYFARPDGMADEPKLLCLGGYGGGMDFFQLKGAVERILAGLRISDVTFESESENPSYHPGRCAKVYAGSKLLGVLGQIHPLAAANYGVDAELYTAELQLDGMLAARGATPVYTPLPRFPAVTRDVAIVCSADIPVAKLSACILAAGGQYLKGCELFDVYTGAPIPAGYKSVAFSLTLRADDQTLTDDHAEETMQSVLKALKETFNATIR